jgi:hypothetical protein
MGLVRAESKAILDLAGAGSDADGSCYVAESKAILGLTRGKTQIFSLSYETKIK